MDLQQFYIDTSHFPITYKEKKQIFKHKRQNSILPNLDEVQILLDNYSNKQDTYIKHNIEAFMSMVKLNRTEHSIHGIDGHYAMSYNFLIKSIPYYSSRESDITRMFNDMFKIEHKGNYKDKDGCSSYSKRLDVTDIIYAKKEVIAQLLIDLIYDRITVQEYINFYNKMVKKQKNTKKTKRIEHISNLIDNDSIISSTNVKSENIEELREYIPKTDREVSYKRIILSSYFNGSIIYNRHFSSVGRHYDLMNQMPKTLREILFKDYIELDINNAAFSIIYKLVNEYINVPVIKDYIDNRGQLIDSIIDYILEMEDNIIHHLIPEFKGLLKQSVLSILLGGRGIFIKRETEAQILINKYIRSVPFIKSLSKEVKMVTEFLKSKSTANSVVAEAYMKVETTAMEDIIVVLSKEMNKNSIVHIHDAVLIPISPSIESINKIKEILNKNGLIIKGLDSICTIESVTVNSSSFSLNKNGLIIKGLDSICTIESVTVNSSSFSLYNIYTIYNIYINTLTHLFKTNFIDIIKPVYIRYSYKLYKINEHIII